MTLVEVLVAVAILSVGLLAIASMQQTAVMVNMRAFDITAAATIAQSQLERLSSLSMDHPDLNEGSHEIKNSAPGEGMSPGYDCDWEVTAGFPNDVTPNPPPARGRLIQVAVTANGDTTSCGEDGTCRSCSSSDGTGSSISCYAIVGVKVTPNW